MDPNVVALFAFCASALGDALVVGAARGVFARAAEALPDGGRALRRLKGLAGDEKSRFCNGIEKELLEIAGKAFSGSEGIRVDRRALRRAKRQITHIIKRAKPEDYAALAKARTPEAVEQVLRRLPRKWGQGIREADRQWFEELVGAVAREYTILAPWSSAFEPRALDAILSELKAIRHDVSVGLENDRVTHSKLDELLAGSVRPGRVLFGGRPDVAFGFRERAEQGRLRGLVVDGAQERAVLVGMAGCGKSQLASSLAQECEAAGWALVAWLNASSNDSIRSDLVELARRLGVDTSDNPTQDQVVRRCLDHLQSAEASDRLVVFDNVERIEDVAGVVPRGVGLRVVATTRNREVLSAWEPVQVGVFPRSDSISFVQSITDSKDDEAADALAERLGDLPLALAQAAETARIERWALAEYLDQLDAYASDRVIRRILGGSYAGDVSTVLWMAVELAIDRLDEEERVVPRRQVGALAVLAESGVPSRWIAPQVRKAQADGNAEKANEDTDADGSSEDADAPNAAAENARRALTALLNASVVQQSTDGGVTMLHRLQGQVLRESWNLEEWAEAFDAAAGLLGQVNIDSLPRKNTEGRRREARDLIDQLRAIAAQDYSHRLFEREQVRVRLHHAFRHANDLGLPYEALTLREAVHVVESILGADHPDTLVLRNNLAGAYQAAGRLGEAITLYAAVIADRSRVLGPNHPQTLTSRNNLALAHQRAGRLSQAISLYKEVVADRVRILGPNHPHTLSSRSNLAYTYQRAGRLSKAIFLYEEVLADCVRVLGPNHPNTLSSRNSLAGAYELAGRLGEAIPLFEDVLTNRVRILGPNHPDTLTSRNNLAGAYQQTGRLNEAIPLFEEVLADCARILGPNHPDTLTSRNNLAYTYQGMGRLNDAILAFEEVLVDRMRVLGPNHPHTLSSRNNLAYAYQRAGRLDEAIPLYEQVLADSMRVLEDDHPHTLTSRNNLAGAYYAAGRLGEAIPLFEEVLADRRRVLGNDHPHTLTSRNNLAAAYQAAGRHHEAINLFKDTLEVCEEALSPDHPLTIQVRRNLEALERETNPAPAAPPESSEE